MTTSVTLESAAVDQIEFDKVADLVRELEPDSAMGVLLTHVLSALTKKMDLTLVLSEQVLSPNEAAELLQMSRPHLLKLIEQGIIKESPRVGTHRRIQMSDLVDYLQRRDQARADVASAVAGRSDTFADLVGQVAGAGGPAKGQFLL